MKKLLLIALIAGLSIQADVNIPAKYQVQTKYLGTGKLKEQSEDETTWKGQFASNNPLLHTNSYYNFVQAWAGNSECNTEAGVATFDDADEKDVAFWGTAGNNGALKNDGKCDGFFDDIDGSYDIYTVIPYSAVYCQEFINSQDLGAAGKKWKKCFDAAMKKVELDDNKTFKSYLTWPEGEEWVVSSTTIDRAADKFIYNDFWFCVQANGCGTIDYSDNSDKNDPWYDTYHSNVEEKLAACGIEGKTINQDASNLKECFAGILSNLLDEDKQGFFCYHECSYWQGWFNKDTEVTAPKEFDGEAREHEDSFQGSKKTILEGFIKCINGASGELNWEKGPAPSSVENDRWNSDETQLYVNQGTIGTEVRTVETSKRNKYQFTRQCLQYSGDCMNARWWITNQYHEQDTLHNSLNSCLTSCIYNNGFTRLSDNDGTNADDNGDASYRINNYIYFAIGDEFRKCHYNIEREWSALIREHYQPRGEESNATVLTIVSMILAVFALIA